MVQVGPDGAVVARGEIDVASVSDFERVLFSVADGTGPVVVDLVGVSFIDSSGMNALVRCYKRLEPTGRRLVVRGSQPSVARSLDIGGITSLVDLEP